MPKKHKHKEPQQPKEPEEPKEPKSRMVPTFPKGTCVIHDDGTFEYRGMVTRAKRVKGVDFFTYDVDVRAWRVKGEIEWIPYFKYDVSDYSLRFDDEP